MDRRKFIINTAAAGSAFAFGSKTLAEGNVPNDFLTTTAEGQTRFNQAMRWAQLAFVESDPGNYDPAFWLNYFKKIHAEGALLSAGGIVAFYPTDIPLHHRSDWLKDKDVLGELVEGCRKMNMSVILRTDPHATRQEMFDAHPDYIAVTADGQKRRHWANPELWVTCALGPYNFEFMTKVIQEITMRYKPDGIFSNRWAGHGICYCEHCVKNFKSFSGLDLPKTSERLDPTYQKWTQWRMERLRELWLHWDAAIRKIDDDSRFIPNGFPDRLLTGKHADFFFADQQARRGVIPPWSNGKGAKKLRATLGMKPLVGIFSVGVEEEYRWKDSVQSEAETRIWVAEGTASGMKPCFVKFSAVMYDKRWLDTVDKIYQTHFKSARYLKNVSPVARVGIVYSEQTDQNYGGKPWQRNIGDHENGLYHLMVEDSMPFEMVNDRMLDETNLSPFKLLILPNIAALSDSQCEQLRKFTQRGGSIVATFETSLYDEQGKLRNNFGLADVFGVSYDRGVEGPMQNSYLRLKSDSSGNQFHPILKGLENAFRIINTVHQVKVTPNTQFPSPVTIIPTYPDLPMEDVYPRVADTSNRGVYLRETGDARIAYIPGDMDRSFWQIMNPDHSRLLRNIVRWALNEVPMAEVRSPGSVIDVALWRQEKSMTVHLVNLTNPMMMKGPFRELIPVSAEVSIRSPKGSKVTGVQLLVSEQKPKYTINGDVVTVQVPKILDHEIVGIDLA
ncbi:MAG: alpha-amylase family protein [Cyclobacteriaceae bacterium]